MKTISCILSALILWNSYLLGNAFAYDVKSGVLGSSEAWEGEIKVEGDVVVPEGMELEIRPGTVLFYEHKDKMNYGREEDLPEIVVYGALKIGERSNGSGQFELIPLDSKTRIIKISPYEVDTKSLRDEFRAFKVQYAVIWTLLGAALIYTVASR